MNKLTFTSKVFNLGINPYVEVLEYVLEELYRQAGKDKGLIPVRGKLNGKPFIQTVVKYQGALRLYLNTWMRQAAGIDVGDKANVEIVFDPKPRIEPMPPKFVLALSKIKEAKAAFEKRPPSHQKEILRYLNSLKTKESLEQNIQKVIAHLLDKKPKGLYALMRRSTHKVRI